MHYFDLIYMMICSVLDCVKLIYAKDNGKWRVSSEKSILLAIF